MDFLKKLKGKLFFSFNELFNFLLFFIIFFYFLLTFYYF
jgi:hypothetical protein